MSEPNDAIERHRFLFTVHTFATDTFAVTGLVGVEGVSRTYWFELELLSEEKDLDLRGLVNKSATLQILSGAGNSESIYHGIVTECEHLQEIDQNALYRVRMEPWLVNARGQVQSEVYLDKTVPAIIDGVFKDSGLSVNDYQLRLTGDVNTRSYEYLCQYEESDLNFLQWLLEQNGVCYFFEDDGSSEEVIFANNQASQGGATRKLTYKPVSGTENDDTLEDSVQRIMRSDEPLPKTVVVRNYDYRKAALDIRYEEMVSESGVGQVALYGEPVGTQAEAQKVARLRADEIACRGVTYEADATAVGIRPGMTVELTDHYRSDFNAKYWVTEVRHEGSQSGAFLAGLNSYQHPGRTESALFYRCTFKAIPKGVQYRPPRSTTRPKIEGTLSGFVDAEGSGKYAELDDQGRYKVQVPFDLTDKRAQRASAWLRFATPYAGSSDEGMHFPLRKGSEVLLSFEGGDPNRPIIIGAVANSEHANVVTNRNSTCNMLQTGGGNLLQMQDQEGSQHIVLKTPTSNSFLAMGAGTGAAMVANALGAGNGNGANPAPTMVQYTQADQLIKAQGSLRVEVGPTATTTATLVAGDTSLTASHNLLQNVGAGGGAGAAPSGYAQLNAGSGLSPATPAVGDVQINTANDFVLDATGNYSLNCDTLKIRDTSYTLNIAGKTNKNVKGTTFTTSSGFYFKNIYGEQVTISAGITSSIHGALYTRVFVPGRLSYFLGPRWDWVMVMKVDIAGTKGEMLAGLKKEIKTCCIGTKTIRYRISATEVEDRVACLDTILSILHDEATSIGNGAAEVKPVGQNIIV